MRPGGGLDSRGMRRARIGGWPGCADPLGRRGLRRRDWRSPRGCRRQAGHCGTSASYGGTALQLERDRRQRVCQLHAASAIMGRFKRFLFALLGKDPEAVVVSFWTGPDALVLKMIEEIRELVPDREHYVVAIGPGPKPAGLIRIEIEPRDLYLQLHAALGRKRVGLAPVLFSGEPHPLRAVAACLAPTRILAYNRNLERHHLRLSTAIASCLFLRGTPLDRIFLRPSWLCPWKKDRTKVPGDAHVVEGRPLDSRRRRVAIISPYF